MARITTRLIIVVIAMAFFVAPGACRAADRVIRLSDRKVITFDTMIGELKGINLVFVGELHAVREHHDIQLQMIRSLHRAGTPLAIALEMFTADAQADLDRWVVGMVEEEEFVKRYARNWSLPWPLYRDIFLYARDNRIPLVGINIRKGLVQKVAQGGYSSLTPDEKQELPGTITCNVNSTYMAFVRSAFAGHFGNDTSFLHFCEAQMVWTKSMARHLMTLLEQHPRQNVVVLTGVGHAMKMGIPDEIRGNSPFSFKVVIPEVTDLSSKNPTNADADYMIPAAP